MKDLILVLAFAAIIVLSLYFTNKMLKRHLIRIGEIAQGVGLLVNKQKAEFRKLNKQMFQVYVYIAAASILYICLLLLL
jgi:hypothetical protein